MDDITFQAGEHNPSIQYVKIGKLGVGEISRERGEYVFHHWGHVTAKLDEFDFSVLMAAINQHITVLNITVRLLKKR